jgi:hypothetical protein
MRDFVRNEIILTYSETAEEVDISYGSYRAILTKDLGIRGASARSVPQLLTHERKEIPYM